MHIQFSWFLLPLYVWKVHLQPDLLVIEHGFIQRGKAKFYLQQNEWTLPSQTGITHADCMKDMFHSVTSWCSHRHSMNKARFCLVSNVMRIFVQSFQFKVFVVHDYSAGHT
jgi:hypothetical protein